MWLFWDIILCCPVAVAMAWYKHELLLGAAVQLQKFYYLHMHSSKNDRKNWSGQNQNSQTTCYGGQCIIARLPLWDILGAVVQVEEFHDQR